MEHVTIIQMEVTVGNYIFEKTGEKVTIDIQDKARMYPRMMQASYLQDQLIKLNMAYSVAKTYYNGKEEEN